MAILRRPTAIPSGFGAYTEMSAHHGRGMMALALGRPLAEAEDLFNQSLKVCRNERLVIEEGPCYLGLADVYAKLGEAGKAIARRPSSRSTAQSSSSTRSSPRNSNSMASALATPSPPSTPSTPSTPSAPPSKPSTQTSPNKAAPDGTVTLLFSDIIDSTATNERLGDTAWMALLREHNQIIREHVTANNGYEVESMGDGFMLAFRSARDGLNCAIGIQRAILTRNEAAGEPVEVRIGLHTGEAVQEQGDFFGKHVNLAARIGGSAGGGEILVSALLAQLVSPSGDFTLSERPAMSLKGLDGKHVTHGVQWR